MTVGLSLGERRWRLIRRGDPLGELVDLLTHQSAQFSRASDGYAYNAAGLLVRHDPNVLRYQHDPATGELLGALIEEERVGENKWSNDLSRWTILGNSHNVAYGQLDPAGGDTASLVENLDAGSAVRRQINFPEEILPAPGAGRARFFVRKGTGGPANLGIAGFDAGGAGAHVNWYPDISNPTVGVAPDGKEVRDAGDWWEFILPPNPAAVKVFALVFGLTATPSSAVVWGCQIEVGYGATSPIPTTGAAATRSPDLLTLPAGGWYRAAEGTFIADVRGLQTGLGRPDPLTVLSRDDTAALLEIDADGTAVRVPGGPEITGLAPASAYKVAISYSSGSVILSVGGQSATASMAWPGVASFGLGSIAGDTALNGCLAQAAYRPTAFSASTLNGITS